MSLSTCGRGARGVGKQSELVECAILCWLTLCSGRAPESLG